MTSMKPGCKTYYKEIRQYFQISYVLHVGKISSNDQNHLHYKIMHLENTCKNDQSCSCKLCWLNTVGLKEIQK